MKYHVNHDYKSGRGAFDAGTEVDLDEADARWYETDSPGLLTPAGKAKVDETTTDEAKPKRGRPAGKAKVDETTTDDGEGAMSSQDVSGIVRG